MTTHNEVHPCLTQLSEVPPPAQLHGSQYCILSFVPSNDRDNRLETLFARLFCCCCYCCFPLGITFVSLKASGVKRRGKRAETHVSAPYAVNARAAGRQTDAQQLIYMKLKESELSFLSRAVRDVPGTVCFCFALFCLWGCILDGEMLSEH